MLRFSCWKLASVSKSDSSRQAFYGMSSQICSSSFLKSSKNGRPRRMRSSGMPAWFVTSKSSLPRKKRTAQSCASSSNNFAGRSWKETYQQLFDRSDRGQKPEVSAVNLQRIQMLMSWVSPLQTGLRTSRDVFLQASKDVFLQVRIDALLQALKDAHLPMWRYVLLLMTDAPLNSSLQHLLCKPAVLLLVRGCSHGRPGNQLIARRPCGFNMSQHQMLRQ
mmetsp:Transcript_28455/g.51426  ORF Transcript_28455/g.51426 Transcript_28455/m.51426 type:complete len:220 (+) Transcript_28455:226-885(+)